MHDPTRDAAFALISAVLDAHRPLDEALGALPEIEARDRSAAHRLAAATLRRLGSLDAVLECFLRRTPPDPVRHVLRLGAAGLLLLDTPAHAAVGTAVALARARGVASFAGLINAVLRKVAAEGSERLAALDAPRLDTPAWLWASWLPESRAIAQAHQQEAPLDLTIRPEAPPPAGAAPLLPLSWRVGAGSRVQDLPGYAAGAFWVQDVAATIPARLVAALPGESVADLCAAPGGKTAQLAATGASVTAVERDERRMRRLRENMARLRLNPTLVLADAAEWRPPADALFDAVLLDAPCSATGTIRRHPDIPHLKHPRDLPALTAQQDRLLAAACAMLRPGGRLVYSVCSLQPEEGPGRVQQALARLALTADAVNPGELAGLEAAVLPDGTVRTSPTLWAGRGGMDGFYIARFRRR